MFGVMKEVHQRLLCPVAVQDRCIGSLVVFDEKDHFFCASSSYAQASLDNEKVPCSSIYLNVELASLAELENGKVDGHQTKEMMKKTFRT